MFDSQFEAFRGYLHLRNPQKRPKRLYMIPKRTQLGYEPIGQG